MYKRADLGKNLQITALYSAFERGYEPDFYFGGQHHNFWEIVIVTEGEIGVTANDEAFVLKKGQAILHEPMEFHRLWSEGKSSPRAVIFTFGAENMPIPHSKIFEVNDVDEVQGILKGVQDAFCMRDIYIEKIKYHDGISHQIALKNFELFLLKTISQRVTKEPERKGRGARQYAKVVQFLESNLHKSFTVAEIAKECSMSEINLKKTFSRYAGIGVMTYFNRQKITAAISMIQKGMSMQEVSRALGFSNQNYFSTAFRRITGHAPSYYKPN